MYLHDVLLLVLYDIVHALLRSLVRVSELLLCLNHTGALKNGKNIKNKTRNLRLRQSDEDLGVLIEDLEKPDED